MLIQDVPKRIPFQIRVLINAIIVNITKQIPNASERFPNTDIT